MRASAVRCTSESWRLRYSIRSELVAAARREREADEPAPVGRHEVDVLGRDALGRDAEVALVLAVLVVHEDDHAAGADLGERLLGTDHVRALAAGGHRLFASDDRRGV